jgi:hypothetical protein
VPTKSERFSNLGESTVDTGYTAGDPTIDVVDASTFPADGIFRIRLDNPSETILIVSSVSGDTFTVEAEEFDGNASAGVAVVQVGTKGQQERFLQGPVDGEPNAPWGVSGGDFAGPIWKIVPLDQSAWSWVNQGSATVVQGSGVVYFASTFAAGTNVRIRVKTAPSPPYRIEAGVKTWFSAGTLNTSLMATGILFRESGTGELSSVLITNFTIATANHPASVGAVNYNSPTSFNAIIGAERNTVLGQVMWLAIEDNNTDLIFQASIDRVNWETLATIGRTSFMAGGPDQVGIHLTNQAGGTSASASFFHWEES